MSSSYKSILQNMQESISSERKKVDDDRKKSNTDFLLHVSCSREIMNDIDSMYSDAKSKYDSEIERLDALFGKVRKSRDSYMQSLRDQQIKARKDVEEVKSTLDIVKSMPLLNSFSVKEDVQELLVDAISRCEYVDRVQRDFSRSLSKVGVEGPVKPPVATRDLQPITHDVQPIDLMQNAWKPLVVYSHSGRDYTDSESQSSMSSEIVDSFLVPPKAPITPGDLLPLTDLSKDAWK